MKNELDNQYEEAAKKKNSYPKKEKRKLARLLLSGMFKVMGLFCVFVFDRVLKHSLGRCKW